MTNPERGYYRHTETHYGLASKPYAPLDSAVLTGWRQKEGVTLVLRVFYLDKYVAQDTLDADFLAKVKADLDAARAAKVKLIVRFAYSQTSRSDAPPARAVGHISQLAPLLNDAQGTIFALQAGFVGQWGEWYYTENYGSDKARPWILTQADWDARAQVLNALLDKTVRTIPVQVRTVGIKQRLLPPTDPRARRVGIANDCFLGKYDDQGTYSVSADREWLAAETRTVLMGGETCEVNVNGGVPGGTANRSLWPTASSELQTYHWTTLNDRYHPDVLASWGTTGSTRNKARLGYRLRLVSASLPTTTTAGGVMSLQLTFANDGYASLVRARKVYLGLRDAAGTRIVSRSLNIDPRSIQAATTKTFSVRMTTPSVPAGTYDLLLLMPDPVPALAADSAYAIRLANSNMAWTGRGYNGLSAQIRVNAAG